MKIYVIRHGRTNCKNEEKYNGKYIVLPEYQSQKVGTNIIKRILKKVDEFKALNPNIRTYLGAVKGKETFYKQFRFITRKEANLGEGMILK